MLHDINTHNYIIMKSKLSNCPHILTELQTNYPHCSTTVYFREPSSEQIAESEKLHQPTW